MCERGRRLDEVVLEVERREEGRSRYQRVDRGADVMAESRQRQLGCACSPSNRVRSFDDEDRAPGCGERDGGRKPVRTGADDNRV